VRTPNQLHTMEAMSSTPESFSEERPGRIGLANLLIF
jgi:hypothetical protein